jgi:colanic acid/amylovoran biosynthesis glycosyltransferase
MIAYKKRIGLVLSAVPGYSETFFRNKIYGLQTAGYEVFLFVTDEYGSAPVAFGCSVISAPDFKKPLFRKTLISLRVLLKTLVLYPVLSYKHILLDRNDGLSYQDCLKRLIQNGFLFKHQLDWLHFGFGMLAVGRENVAKALGANMAVSFRGFDLYLSPLKHPNCYELLFQKNIRYHVLSQEMRKDLQAYGIAKKAIWVITPAIDTSFFSGLLANETPATYQFLTVARLHWKKGLIYTLEALALLKQSGISFNYTIVGVGNQYERLVFAVHQLGLKDCVALVGKQAPKEVRELMQQSHIYLQYSIQEGFCNAVLEAQAMGLLCVVSDAEGLAENVLHEQTGYVVPKRQPQDLARCLQTLTQTPFSNYSEMRRIASHRVKKQFDLEQQQQQFVAFYQN